MTRLHKRIDFMAGSERMLKAHHKNAVFLKTLENKKMAYDQSCTKSLGKMQQDIYEVYFNEYLPLKEEASKIRQRLPAVDESLPHRLHLETIPGRGNKVVLPDILASQTSITREGTCIITDTERYLDTLREKAEARRKREKEVGNNKKYDLVSRDGRDMNHPDGQPASPCSWWPDAISENSETPVIDEKRLEILKTAIALTSQPVKPPEPRKTRRLRKSFLVNLRRQSKQVWENEVIRRVFCEQHQEQTQRKPSVKTQSESSDVMNWRPSLAKNKIFNEEDDDESDDFVFHFADRASRDSRASLFSDISMKSSKKEVPLHDIEEDLYHPESSPDIFSVISERTGSGYSGSSFTTGSGSDYSYYTTDSEEAFT